MVGRKTFRNLGERMRNAMNIRRGGGYRNLARSGQNPQHARAISASRSTTAWAVAIVVAMIAAVTVMFVPAPAAQADGTTVVDPDTTNAWSDIAASSTNTQNIGRIWTDKSVFNSDYDFEGALDGTSVAKGDDSDFLVGLSAISSTSNLKSTVTNTTPLDIVLVVDTSGSMDNSDGHDMGYAYSPTYNVNNWGTYYIQINGRWTELSHNNQGWYYGNRFNPTYVDYARYEGDTAGGRVQFYTRSNQQMSRMEALQNAANAFVDSVAAMNDDITDTAQQHRISLVKFASDENNSIGNGTDRDGFNYSQVVSDLTVYTTQNASTLKNTINSLEGEGATRADYGMHQAQRVLDGDGNLTGARSDAQKVVIFFTDGNPTTSSAWSNSVAGAAINYAYDMKQDGALVYSIGVFQGANPSDTNSDFNRYMNAVSSNYPNAQCADYVNVGSYWDPQYELQQTNDYGDLDLGDRAEGSEGEETPQYYFAASNADELNQVFKDITESLPINEGSGSPIEEQEGAAGTPGYLTFTDTLGSFMEVTGVGASNNKMYLAFADGLHEGTPNEDGTVWTFSGTVNEGQGVNTAYPEGADLSEIKVTVTKSNDLATGDIITVQIPASLIPMRNYDVDTDNGTMTISDTYPVRLFYGVSVKDGAIDALNNPQDKNHNAVLAQTSADGKTVDFYSNSFVKNAAEGSTEASFTPSDGNKFYYYPANTQLFTDENCTQPATRNNIGRYSMLYYKDSYWQLPGDGNAAEEVPSNGSITRSGNDWRVTYQGNNAYIAANTPRADRPGTLVANKGKNTTETASTVLTPTWVGSSVSQKLGNNGKLSIPAPGDLRIDKTVDWGNASNDTKTNKNSFKFTVHLYTEAEDGTQNNLTNNYSYAVYGTGEEPESTGTISDNGEITLAAGQYVVISDLPDGAKYTVTEQSADQNGFKTTDNSTGENANTTDGVVEGAIVGGDQQIASFTNTYHATEVDLNGASQLIKVRKNLTGRDWQDTDEFRFTMRAEGNAPAPESSDPVVIDDEDAAANYTANLSNIKFENPGTYTYVIEEDNDTNPIAGIDYSNETYAVTITVVDNGTGALQIGSVKFVQRADVDGNEPAEQPQITDNTVVFTNNYDAEEATTNLNGTKDYTDNSGSNPNAANKFTFELKAIGGYATEGGSADNPTIDAANVPMPEGADANTHTITIGNNGTNPDGFAFQTIKYDGTHLNNTYIYEIREVIPQGATENSNGTWTLNGMTYDGTVHTVTVKVADEPNTQGEGVHIVATPSMQPADVQFTNVYDPEDYKLTGDEAIHGTKVLQGREIGDNETFYFQLKQTDGPETVLDTPETKTVTKNSGMDFTFSDLTFTKAGTYTFTVNEVANEQGDETTDGKGMTYSQNVAEVTIKVKDGGNGSLVLDGPIVYKNQDSDEIAKAVFTNVYKASMKYGAEGKGGINVTKQLLDRPMTVGEFNFAITGEGDAANMTADVDESFQNTAAAADKPISMAKLQNLTFNETNAGKTYTFLVDEVEPAEGQGLAGVTYDKSQYKVEIEVVDNGDGSMHTVTTVTRTMDKDGNEIADGGTVVVDHANSDADDYAVPIFGFVNDYNPDSVTIGENTGNPIQVVKTVQGAPSPGDVAYSFTLKLTSDNKAGISEGLEQEDDAWVAHVSTNGVINQDAENGTDDDSQTVTFGDITFTEPGTYTFDVAEDTLAADDGWTFDTTPKMVTVVVSDLNKDDQYDGKLHIESVTGSPVQVTNRYKAGSTTTGDGDLDKLQVTKTVTGAPATEEFGFELTPAEDYGDKVEGLNDEGKLTVSTTDLKGKEESRTLEFGDLTFNAEGTYKFDVKETNADPAEGSGWTYDNDAAKQITVVVTDEDHDGKLDATTVVNGQDTNNPTFTNAYVPAEVTTDAGAGTAIQVTKKVTGHDAIEAFGFSLSLKDGQNADAVFEGKGEDKTKFEGMTLTTSDGIKAGKTETKPFGDITFTEAGDYTFVIDETTEKTDGGWTYDTDTEEVTVHVKDDGQGKLYIESIDNNAPTFENVYQLQPAKFRAARFQLQGNKVLDGRNWETGDEFTFTLTAGRGDNVDGSQMSEDEVAATMPDSTSDTIRPADGDGSKVTDNSAQFTFTDERFPGEDIVGNEDDVFTYTKPGTYRYLIRETNPNVSNPGSGILGVSYDQTVYRLTVKVTDNGDGTMNAEGSYTRRNADGTWADLTGSNEVTFTNKYSSDEIDVTFNAFKVLEDRDQNMEDGEFTFHMEFAGWAANDANADPDDDSDWTMDDTTDAPKAAEDTGNIIRGDVTFGEMAFTKDNVGYTYRYKITENAGTVPGVTYDKSVHYVTAKVTSVSTPDDPQDPDGAYTEHVRVETSGEAEWNEQTGTAPTSGAIFTNTYEAGAATGVPANFQLTKQFTGHEWTDDYGFEFTLAAQDSELADGTPVDAADVPMPASATKTVNAPDKEGGDTAIFDFGGISYDKAGTYRYTVTETHAGETLDGITYDAQPAQVTVTVTEGKDSTGALTGQLVATATVTNGDFVNTYETSAVYNANGVGGLDITKQVTNHVMTDGQFSFTITATGDNADAAAKKLGIEDGATTTVESAQAAAGVATSVKNNPFETVVFDKSDDGVTYTYTIKENGKTGEGDYKNYVLDTNTYTVEITPTDNGDGTMTVKTVVDGTETTNQRTTVAFVNSYQADPTTVGAEGAATIEGTKTLKNDILADGQFTFQVKSGDVVVATGTNATNGTITFDDITYTTENLAAAATPEGSPEVGKTAGAPQVTDKGTVYTFNYTVSEVEPAADSGVTASTAAQNITVTVTDDGNGTLTPVVTYGDGDPLAFENVYGGDAEFPLDIAGAKQIVGAQDGLNVPVLKADDYEFTIVGNPAQDGTPAPMPAVTTVANDASGNVTFEDIVYTMENTFGHASATGVATLTAGRTQVFTYTISESGSVDGVTNEQGTKTVEVTVTDLGGGKLEAEVTSVKTDEGADFAFTNVYDVNPTTSSLTGKSGFEITKKLTSDTGRKLAKDEFSFQLTSGDTVVATASNDADGTVSFDGITFTKPGTYNYVLSEVNDGKPGVDYDATKYNVIATAEDQGDGTLKVTWEMPQAANDAVTFTNVYDPADATVTLGAGKTFAGADLKDAQFTFQLTGADESTPMPEGAKDGVSTATNDENGSIVFGTIAYDKPGTYKYTVSEVNDEQDGVTYDDTTYEVTVTVTDDTATGTLKAAVSYGDADAMVFSNQYKKPVEPAKPTIPKTGIDVIIPGVAGLVLLLGAGGVYAFKRRKRS